MTNIILTTRLLILAMLAAVYGCNNHGHSHPHDASEPGSHHAHDEHHGHANGGSDHHDEGHAHGGHDHGNDKSGHHDEGHAHGGHDHGDDKGGHHDEGHAHGGGDAIGITRWTDKLELFAEHPPAIAGQELRFLAHLTILDTFAPVEDAAVKLVLSGEAHAEAEVKQKLRSGIFEPRLIAPAPGLYKARLEVRGPKVQDTIDGFEIQVHATPTDAAHATNDSEDASSTIGFLKEQQWQVPFATEFAKDSELVPTIEVSGEVTTPPSGQAEVGAAISGRVVAPSRGLPRPGQAVRRGDVLAQIAPAPAAPEAGARADLAVVEAEARLQAARAALERAERLIADRAISQREADEARREFEVAKEARTAARRASDVFSGAASGRGGGIYRVTAPIDGVIVEVEASEGKSVNNGQLLFRIVNLKDLWIRARVPEQQAALIRADQDAAFKLSGIDTWLPIRVTGPKTNASVVNVGRTVHRVSRTVDVIYALRMQDERLRVGSMLRVAVPIGPAWKGVVLPESAVLSTEGRSIVYVQPEGESFEERVVRLGPRSGGRVAIHDGVSIGERIVTKGANVIRLSARAADGASHGHVH